MARVTHALFQAHKKNRNKLLERLTTSLKQNHQVAAAWLMGSLGTEKADDLSDIDLFVVVFDKHIGDGATFKKPFVTKPGSVLLKIDAPVGPPEGDFLHVLYDSPTGPLIVDWYWQKQSAAIIPAQTKLLFDRVNLPYTNQQARWDMQPPLKRTERETDEIMVGYLWYSIPHLAKYFARSPWVKEVPTATTKLFEDVCLRFDVTPPVFDIASFEKPDVKLKLINQMTKCAESMEPLVRARGLKISPDIVHSTYRFLAPFRSYLTSME